MSENSSSYTRRAILKTIGIGIGSGAFALSHLAGANAFAQQQPIAGKRLSPFTGPGANPYWNSVGPMATYPQKAPLVLLTDRPVQLETPRHYFLEPITPNDAFFVRWHLESIPNEVDLSSWRLRIEGNVNKPLALSFSDLLHKFKPVTFAAVNQC